jgi:tRNA(adenine34) deaminase
LQLVNLCQMNQPEKYLQRCTELAAMAAAEGESPVGCVIVKDGVILGEAFEKSRQLKDITRHAEVLAVLDTLQRHGSCAGATLYTNVEPCILCSYVIRHHKIAEVVFSKACGELGGTGPLFNLLTTNTITAWGKAPIVHKIP